MKKIPHKLLIFTAILLVVIVFFVALDIVNANRINLGTEIAGISVGGLSQKDALEKLEFNYQQLIAENFSLIYKNLIWTVNLKSMGIEIDVPTTVNLAFSHGHEKNKFLSNRWWQIGSFFGYNLEPTWNINEEKLEKFLRENLSAIHQPAKNSILVYNKKIQDFIVAPSKAGIVIDKNEFKKNLAKIVNDFQTSDIKLSLVEDQPEVIESETDKARQEAKKILQNAPITIATEDQKEVDTINKDGLLNLMDFVPVPDESNPKNKILGVEFNKEKIENYLVSLSSLVNQEPINAQLMVKDNRVTAFALSQDGVKLGIGDNLAILAQGLLNPPTDKKIQLKTDKTKPKITTDTIDNFGITSLLSKGVSNFSGSPANRIHNIKVGAAKFNGVLLKSGDEFSFDNILGEVGPEQGYEPELVILKDKTAPEYGGGLCQVSTTTSEPRCWQDWKSPNATPMLFRLNIIIPRALMPRFILLLRI